MKLNAASLLNFSAIFGACLYAATAHADVSPAPHQPPKEAVDACASKAENDACSFTGRQSELISGTCRKGPDGNGPLACVPAGHKPGDAGNPHPAQ